MTMGAQVLHCGEADTECIAHVAFIICGRVEEGMNFSRPLFMTMGAQVVCCGVAGTGCIAKVRFIVGGTEEGLGSARPLF